MEKTNKKISLIITIVFIVSLFIGVILLTYSKYLKNNNIYEEENNNKPTIISKDISMNLEQTAGAGDYKTVTQSNWPIEGYKFNTELSRCENESEISWDDTKKVVVVSGNLSDKCYVYFDLIPSITLVEHVTSLYTGTQGENGIYYHDSSLTNGAGDSSYRYAGANPDNFVCFGSTASLCPTDNLYRIIGVFDENYHGVSGKQLVKLIKYDYANSNLLGTVGDYSASGTPDASYYKGSLTTINTYYWNYKADTANYNNTWSTSLLNKTNLNTNFINNIGTDWSKKIATTTWKVGGGTIENIRDVVPARAYQYEVGSNASSTTYDAKIGLMYASDYGFGAVPEAWTTTLYNYDGSVNGSTIRIQNWMYMGYSEWTISRTANDLSRSFFVGYGGGFVNYNIVYNANGVRVAFNLEPTVTYVSGTGTQSDPIIIN